MRIKKPRPWLTSTGVEISTTQLREICKGWDLVTWENYLKWYESGCREKILPPDLYKDLCDRQTETIFRQFDQNTDPKKRAYCESLLRLIPASEANVLRLTFFEGRTVREIAANEKIGKSTVQDKKDRALLRLQRGQQGDNPDTRHLMRGKAFEDKSDQQSLWMQPLSFLIREDRVYDPSQYKEEFLKINHLGLKRAVAKLSDREQRILYLRFWCDCSISDIARELHSGVNLIEQVIDAMISKLKRKIVRNETGYKPGEGPSCA